MAVISKTRTAADETGGLSLLLRDTWRHRDLLAELVRRDLNESYAGSMLSRAWAILHPLMLIGLYLFVFGYIFTTRVGANLPETPDFAVFLLSGLACWLTVQNALVKSTASLLASSNLVKQVVFPIELLPLRSVISSQLPLIFGVLIVVGYSAVRFGMVSPLLPLVPVVMLAQMAILIGLGLFLSAMAVFVRDTRDFVQFFSAFGVFLLPVIYLPGTLPNWFLTALWFNPLSHAMWCLQDIFFFQSFRHPLAWVLLGLSAIIMPWLGWRFFQRTRHNFGDVL
jgi:lipopolysaccharide transport system permease protein